MYRLIIFVFLWASIGALTVPKANSNTTDTRDARFIGNAISKAIQDASQALKNSGHDPIYISKKHVHINLPVPVIFNAEACFKDIIIGGFSNIQIHRINFSIFRSRLDFDIELPLIYLYGSSTFKTTLFGKKFSGMASGLIEIHRIRVIGQIQFNIFSGTIRSINIQFTLGGINSDVKLIIQSRDFSNNANYFIGITIPTTIAAYSPYIDELLVILLENFINENLRYSHELSYFG